MFLKLDELKQLHEKWSNSTLEELNTMLDGYTDEQIGMAEPLTPALAKTIADFMSLGIFNSGFGVSSVAAALYQTVTAKAKKGSTTVLNITEFKTLQKLIVDSKPTSIEQMITIDALLQSTSAINMKLSLIEEKARLISPIIVRKETEIETGLVFSEEDNENVKPSEANTPAEMHVVSEALVEAADTDEVAK